jgi:effector-binding domain-containing protein
MNRLKLCGNVLLTAALMLGFAVVSASAQDDAMQQLSAREKQAVRASAARPVARSFWAVTQDFEGNFDNVDSYMARFAEEAKAQNIPNANPTGILVLYEDPTGKTSFRMGVGIALTRRVNVKAPLKVERMAFSRAVSHTVTGPYKKLDPVGRALVGAVKERHAKAGRDMAMSMSGPFAAVKLLNDPKKVKPEQVRTEIILPVQ